MIAKLVVCFLLLALAATNSSFGQTEAQIAYWKSVLTGSELSQIEAKLKDSSAPRWPIIVSPSAANQLPPEKKQLAWEALQLGELLIGKMSQEFERDKNPDYAGRASLVKLFSSVGKTVYQTGGYGNLVVADAARRLALYHVSGAVVFYPQRANEASELLSAVQIPALDVAALLTTFGNQDPTIEDVDGLVKKVNLGKGLFEIFDIGGDNFRFLADASALNSKALLNQTSIVGLIFRLAFTQLMASVDIPGAIQFFKNGGTYEEVDPKDIGPFEQRMGVYANAFKYPVLGIKCFKETDILYLVAIHKDEAARAAYLEIAMP